MSSPSHTIVQIFGNQYRIGSASADPGHIRGAATLLDERMRSVATSCRRKVPLEIAILAAMEIADEVLQARNAKDQLLTEADERISRFTRKLEGGTGDLFDRGDISPPAPRF